MYLFSSRLNRERMMCKHSLTSSACGVHIGRFAYDVMLLVNHEILDEYNCDRNQDPGRYHGKGARESNGDRRGQKISIVKIERYL